MAHTVKNTVRRAEQFVMGSGTAKINDLEQDTQTPSNKTRLTTDFGVLEATHDNTLKIVSSDHTGPHLLEDHFAREKISHFDRERIPERVVHARGAGAFGTFRLLESASDVTMAPVLTDMTRETPVFVRFSTVLGSRGSADTVRDVRGFAIKMYTQEGNWDIVGNNMPVFFIQDSIKFPDLIHAGKPEPHVEVPQAQSAHNNFWDFVNLHTEATHMYLWTMSDRAIPRSYRMMQGFGVNTFTLINAQGQRHFVKFHWTPTLGVHSLVWDEALKLAGQDPDFHRKDLYEAIENKAYPRWKFGIQTIAEADEHMFDFDILDATKLWPEERVPIRYIGELELNRNVDEYFTQTEQVAFCTSHVVPGIGFSDDPLLQGRNFSYMDTQLTRLGGPNWQELPINRPVCPVMNFQRDGFGRHTVSQGKVNYWPNRFGTVPPARPDQGAYVDYPQPLAGRKARALSAKFKDHFSQAHLFWNSLSPVEKKHATSAFCFELDHCDDPLVFQAMGKRLADIDLTLAQTVADMVGAEVPTQAGRPNSGVSARGLSQLDFPADSPTMATRKVGILLAEGFDLAAFTAMERAVTAAQAIPVVIGTKRSPMASADGTTVTPNHHLEGFRSTMLDALFIPGGAAAALALARNGRAMHYVRETFGHLKALGATGEAVDMVAAAIGLPQVTMSHDGAVHESYGVVTLRQTRPESFAETVTLAKGAVGFVNRFFHAISLHRNWDRELHGLNVQVAF